MIAKISSQVFYKNDVRVPQPKKIKFADWEFALTNNSQESHMMVAIFKDLSNS